MPEPELNEFTCLERPATMASFAEIQTFVADGARAAGLPEEKLWNVELVVEELVTNVIRHGYPPGQTGSVSVGYSGSPGYPFRVQIRSGGAAFNPLLQKPVDLTLDIADRIPGGLGIHLVKNLAHEITYQRLEDINVISFAILP